MPEETLPPRASVEFNSDEHVGRQALRFAELLGCTDLPENRPQIFLPTPPERNDTVVSRREQALRRNVGRWIILRSWRIC